MMKQFAQFAEPLGAVAQVQHDQHRPFVTDAVEHQPGRAADLGVFGSFFHNIQRVLQYL
ncbi:hypothetical protein [Streptomyces sp. NPDC056683]|uniref:hypothetical protein n=1 Tax=Streptomyces sp. NPDC056683 TaxID=3345910 RepID=UPI00367871CE